MHKRPTPAQRTPGRPRLVVTRLLLIRALGLVGVLLGAAACATSAESADRAPDWISGGQTGSLVPQCGLAEAQVGAGVPASAQGIVVYTSECEGVASGLSLRAADGQPIDVQVRPLGDGAVLLSFDGTPAPGDYSVGGPSDQIVGEDAGARDESDAGFEPDAAVGAPNANESTTQQIVSIEPPVPAPTALGELSQLRGPCGATLELRLDSSMLPYVGTLAIELRIDDGPSRRIVSFGRLRHDDGVAELNVPLDMLEALAPGRHEVRVRAQLPGLALSLESNPVQIGAPCSDEATHSPGSSGAAACSLLPGDRTHGPALMVFAVWAIARVRRRRRPPD